LRGYKDAPGPARYVGLFGCDRLCRSRRWDDDAVSSSVGEILQYIMLKSRRPIHRQMIFFEFSMGEVAVRQSAQIWEIRPILYVFCPECAFCPKCVQNWMGFPA